MSTVNYSLNHRGVRLIGASEARKTTKNRRVETSYPQKIKTSCLIVGEMSSSKCNVTVEEYRYRKIMHVEKNGRHLNEKIKPNPDRSDPNPMYLAYYFYYAVSFDIGSIYRI